MVQINWLRQNLRMKKEPSNLSEVAERLQKTRGAFSASQKDFAERAGINLTQYNNWESGHSRIGLSGALKLCSEYRLSLDWIYFGDPASLPVNIAKALGVMPLVSDQSRSSESPVTQEAKTKGASLSSTL